MTLSERIIEAMAPGILERQWDMPGDRWPGIAALTEHGGDCTKECHICWVCVANQVRRAAAQDFLAGLKTLLEAGPSEAMVETALGHYHVVERDEAREDFCAMLRALLSELEGKEGA